jgi:hypothetical protein
MIDYFHLATFDDCLVATSARQTIQNKGFFHKATTIAQVA